MKDLKTERSLLMAIEAVAQRKPEPGDVERQRVSFIYSAVKESNHVTKSQIAEVLASLR